MEFTFLTEYKAIDKNNIKKLINDLNILASDSLVEARIHSFGNTDLHISIRNNDDKWFILNVKYNEFSGVFVDGGLSNTWVE